MQAYKTTTTSNKCEICNANNLNCLNQFKDERLEIKYSEISFIIYMFEVLKFKQNGLSIFL